MHLRFSSFIALTILIIIAAPHFARASDTPPASLCGKTVEDNLAAARQALQSGDSDSREALACLIEATAKLNKKVADYESGKSDARAWHPPITDYPIKPGQ